LTGLAQTNAMIIVNNTTPAVTRRIRSFELLLNFIFGFMVVWLEATDRNQAPTTKLRGRRAEPLT
jgi:hypothetical protein